jgi:hypothetical protein
MNLGELVCLHGNRLGFNLDGCILARLRSTLSLRDERLLSAQTPIEDIHKSIIARSMADVKRLFS